MRFRLLLSIFIIIMSGCGTTQQEQATMTSEATRFIQQMTVSQGTLYRTENQFGIGLEFVENGEYTDEQGQSQKGVFARISVGDETQTDPTYRAASIIVHEGSIFEAGGRYEVIELHKGSSNGMPGSNSSYMVFGKLAD
ncbi:hypothetical protein [Herpetosiphon sp. NSE202]|uniref:hypothetical protein n=1 Tax=Herpetosiphon sp. NSE202 TaxID=3351349 RepID=UPI0036397173